MATWHEGRFVLLNACDDEGCLVMMGWWDGRGIRHLYMSRLVLCEYSVRSNCWVLCFGGPTYVLRYSSVADSCNSWHGTVSMCRESLWQEQTGSSMLHTFITPKTYIIISRMFFNILIWSVHILCWCVCTYVVCVAYQCRCLVVCEQSRLICVCRWILLWLLP